MTSERREARHQGDGCAATVGCGRSDPACVSRAFTAGIDVIEADRRPIFTAFDPYGRTGPCLGSRQDRVVGRESPDPTVKRADPATETFHNEGRKIFVRIDDPDVPVKVGRNDASDRTGYFPRQKIGDRNGGSDVPAAAKLIRGAFDFPAELDRPLGRIPEIVFKNRDADGGIRVSAVPRVVGHTVDDDGPFFA